MTLLEGGDDKADYIWKLNAARSDLSSDSVRTLDYPSLLMEMDRLFSDDFKEVLKVAGRVCASEILDLGYFENDVSVRLFYQCIAYESEKKARYQGEYIWAVSVWLKDHFYVQDAPSNVSLKLKSSWAETALLRYVAKLQDSEAAQ